jgi:hypothetical protein
MRKIIQHIPLLTVCLLYFGFCNLHYYYKEFKIDIYNYISNSEIILSFFPVIVITSSALYGFFYQQIIGSASFPQLPTRSPVTPQTEQEKGEISKAKRFMRNGGVVATIYLIISGFISFGIQKIFKYKPYDLQYFNLISSAIFCLILLYYIRKHNNTDVIFRNPIIFSIFLVLYTGNGISMYRSADALKIKDGISDKTICFNYNKSKIATSQKLIYIGQTQSAMFFFNRNDSSTQVYQFAKIDSLIVK